ncbi:RpiB/LacA/LacB family sugar-phosphate isomerase [Patescibacteria group bacterium]|nr:RpiB/LacA/LacB family sugar-phosphate isomerase [Patescibacteria group bacterium]
MIYISSDHAGLEMKKKLFDFVKEKLKKQITDLGPKKYDGNDDYPDFAVKLAMEVAKNKDNVGILICGSGHGMCVTANKIKGIRASIGYSIQGAELAKKEDDINVLCLAGRILTNDHASAIVKKFLETKFDEAEKRTRRIQKIEELEK